MALEDDAFARADALLDAALDLPGDQRERFLAESCGGDAALASRVRQLLRLAESEDDPLRPGGAFAASDDTRLSPEPRPRRSPPAPEAPPLAAGQRLGRYEIRGLLGTGGMGRVYRAFDRELGREVALKAMSRTFGEDAPARRRFEREARLLATLSHTNVAAIFGIEELEGARYLVLEKVDGETLSERLRRPIPIPEALSIAAQIAAGLAEAHAKGVIHRDLKPSNVMLTADRRVKLVDFGIAKAMASGEESGAGLGPLTEAGTVLGTAPYMSPEQIQGEELDARTDVWSFGCLLFEMLAGRRAFEGRSGAEAAAAALRDEPDWSAVPEAVPPAVRRLLRRCLRKDRERRLQHIGDARLELLDLETDSDTAPTRPHAERKPARAAARPARIGAAVALAALAAAAAYYAGTRASRHEPPRFQRISYRRGFLRDGRFTPDGQSVVYAAAWEGGPLTMYRRHPESPESVALDLPSGNVLALSRSGELAIAIDCQATHGGVCAGTLARASLTGGAPREIAEGVQQADWTPDGSGLYVVRDVPGGAELLDPAGKVLYRSSGHLSCPRVSPSGDLVAFLDHPLAGDDRGSVAVVDAAGKKRALTKEWGSSFGVAWAPSGREVLFTAAEEGARRELWAVTLSGRVRPVYRAATSVSLLDVSASGRVLLLMEDLRAGMAGRRPGDAAEREVSWLDRSIARAMSADGSLLLFTEESEAAGPGYYVCVRRMDGSPVVRLAPGTAFALSADGKRVLARPAGTADLAILPVGTGPTRTLHLPGLEPVSGSFLPDGRRLLVNAVAPGKPRRPYLGDLETGTWTPFSGEGHAPLVVAPDGSVVVCKGPADELLLEPLDGSAPRPVPSARPGDTAFSFSGDGRLLYVMTARRVPREIDRIDLVSGERARVRDLVPPDRAGVSLVIRPVTSADGATYAYSYYRSLGDLYALDGLLP